MPNKIAILCGGTPAVPSFYCQYGKYSNRNRGNALKMLTLSFGSTCFCNWALKIAFCDMTSLAFGFVKFPAQRYSLHHRVIYIQFSVLGFIVKHLQHLLQLGVHIFSRDVRIVKIIIEHKIDFGKIRTLCTVAEWRIITLTILIHQK